MKITSDLFHAYLKCSTKCWLLTTSELANENKYAEWVKAQNSSYRMAGLSRLFASSSNEEIALSPHLNNLKTAKWHLASGVVTSVQIASNIVESELHAVQRVPAKHPSQSQYLIPIRFTFTNKLDTDDKLLLAFDAFTLSQSLGQEVTFGKIIHGDNYITSRVTISPLIRKVRKSIDKIAALLTSSTPPELILNRHCTQCDFQARCQQEALQKDDLSLLSGMTRKEREKLNSRGTFTVKQLSFAFLPRRRPKKLRNRPERFHSSLKALAIREKKLHIAGQPELLIKGTPVFFDVEGIPDRDFYYLIGLRFRAGDAVVQHSLWADTSHDESRIYFQFLEILKTIEEPSLIHYGSFETDFLKLMGERYGISIQAALEGNLSHATINLLSIIHGQVYFPTYSNSLKSIAPWLGFEWSNTSLAGIKSVAYRCEWEASPDASIKNALIDYNAEDCQAAEVVAQALLKLNTIGPGSKDEQKVADTVHVDSLKNPRNPWGNFESQFKEFEKINAAAWWNYQRDRIVVRVNRILKPKTFRSRGPYLGPRSHLPVNRTIVSPKLSSCPCCDGELTARTLRKRILYDLSFGKSAVKRWIVRYQFRYYWCARCSRKCGEPQEFWPQSHLGRTLVAYVLYHTVELYIPFQTVRNILSRCFKLDMKLHTLMCVKRTAAKQYKSTYDSILRHLLGGQLLHVDETQVSIKGSIAYGLGLHEFARRLLSVHRNSWRLVSSRDVEGL